MKATTLLVQQHRDLASLVAELRAHPAMRVPLLLRLVGQLMAHMAIEGHFFYYDISHTSQPIELDLNGYFDLHARLKSALLQLVHAEADDATFGRALSAFASVLDEHVDAEERSLLPAVEQRVASSALEALGTRMQRFYEGAVVTERESIAGAE